MIGLIIATLMIISVTAYIYREKIKKFIRKHKKKILAVITGGILASGGFMMFDGEPYEEEQGWQLYERGITWNTYYNNKTNQYKTMLWSGVANYQNDTGIWKPVNTSFEILDNNHPAYVYGYRVGNEKGVYSSYFKPNLLQNYSICFAYNRSKNPVTHVLRSQIIACGYIDPSQGWKYEKLQDVQSATGSIDGNIDTYTDAFTGVNISFTYDNSLLKEDIHLSNQTRTVLKNNPPSDFGLSNQNSYLVYATKLDYKKLYPNVNDVNMTGNFTVMDGGINFRDYEGKIKFAFPVGYAYEKNNVSNFTKLVYRMVQYQGHYYLFAGVKVTELNKLKFPVIIDPTTTLTYTSCKADIHAEDPVGGFPPDKNYELMMRWDISSFVDDPLITAINESFVHLYCYDNRGNSPDTDAKIANISDQNWVLPTVAQYKAMSETTRTDANAFNTSITDDTWVKANVTVEISGNYNANNSYASFRLEDLDWPVDSTAVTAVTNTTYLTFGRKDSRILVPPNNPYVFFGSCSYATTAQRPKLEVIYHQIVNELPELSNPNPANNSLHIETEPECSIYVDDNDSGDTLKVYWYNSTDGSSWTLQQTNSSISPETTVRWDYTEASTYSTDYYWKVAANDTKDNTTAWYNFTTSSTDAQEPDDFNASAHNTSRINLTWTNYERNDRTYIEVNTSGGSVPWTRGSGTFLYNDTGTHYNHTGLNINTKYYYQAWGWNGTDASFSDENASDNATTEPSGSPVASNPYPVNTEDSFSMLETTINATVEDPEGDTFSWSIETSPNVGSNSGSGGNGSKTCTVSLSQSHVVHTWWINATDGIGGQLNQSYTFTTNWYPNMTSFYPANQSIDQEGTPTVRVTVDDADDDTVDLNISSNYTGSWTSYATWTAIDVSGGPVTRNVSMTGFDDPDTKYWWNITVYDDYQDQWDGKNITVKHFTTCSYAETTLMSPANKTMDNTSPVTLRGYVEQPQGFNMNLTFVDYKSGETIGTNTSVANGTYRQSWTRDHGTGQWYIAVESKNFTNNSYIYWFANDQRWDDTYNNSMLIDNIQSEEDSLIPLRDDGTIRFESWFDNSVAGGHVADDTIDTNLDDATQQLAYGKYTVFINSTHGYSFAGKGSNVIVFNTTDGGATWSDSVDSGEESVTAAIWWDGWTYNSNSTVIHCMLSTSDDDYVKYAKFWTSNDTFSSWTNVHQMTDTYTELHRGTICTTPEGNIWMAFWDYQVGSFIYISEDNGVTWTLMDSDAGTEYSFLSVYPLGHVGVMQFALADYGGSEGNSELYASYYLYSNNTWSSDILIHTHGYDGSVVFHDAVYYEKIGELYLTYSHNRISATSEIYFNKFWVNNFTWSNQITVAENKYVWNRPAIALSQGNGDIYVAYTNGTTGLLDVYCVNSTDGGYTWSSEIDISATTDDLRYVNSNWYSYERIYITWANDDLNDLKGATVRTYTKGDAFDYWGTYTSINLTKPTATLWSYFNLSAWEITNISMKLIDEVGENLKTGITGSTDDISSVTNDTIRVFVNFSNSSRLYDVNLSWIDDPAPEIGVITIDSATVGYGFNVTINASVWDNDTGIHIVKCNVTYPDDTYYNFTMTNTSEPYREKEINLTDTWQLGWHNYTVYASDGTLTNTSDQQSFNVSAQCNVTVQTLKDAYDNDDNYINLTDPPNPTKPLDVEAYDYWYAPEDSFGIRETKIVNWSFFKELFLAHTDWILEYKRYSYSDWTDGSDYLTIERTWNDSGFWKFNLILDVPVDIYSARFTFGVDLPCLQYVERSGHEVWINYTANETETYCCMFNWFDIAGIPGLVITKGVQDDIFWFRFRRDDIPAGHYEFDPTFGYTGETSSANLGILGDEYLRAVWATMGATGGKADNITIKTNQLYSTESYQCAIYEYTDYTSDYCGALVGVTEIKQLTDLQDNTVVTFDFSDPKPSLLANTKYYLALRMTTETSNTNSFKADAEANYAIYKLDSSPLSFDNPLIGESASIFKIYIYCSYTESANNAPIQSNEKPDNQSTTVKYSTSGITINVTVGDLDAESMNVSFYTNETGTWTQIGSTNTSVSNGSYQQTYAGFDTRGVKYWWSANVSDGTDWTNETYHFTIEYIESKINNTESYNSSGYLFMIIEYNNSGTWEEVAEIINESTTRTIEDGTELKLDDIWNGNSTITNFTEGTGHYRVYAAFRDPNYNVLLNDDATYMNNSYQFNYTAPEEHIDIIRNNSLDYFIWLGSNCSAWNVSQQITGFDEAEEYVASWNETAFAWDNYTLYQSSTPMYVGSRERHAEKYSDFSGTPISVDFYIGKNGNPTGRVNATVRYVSNDTIIDNDSKLASSIGANAWHTFTFDGNAMLDTVDIYVCIEYWENGDGTNNIMAGHKNVDTRDSWYYHDSWKVFTETLQIRFYYRNNSIWTDSDGIWQYYYGDGSGTNFNVHTFDVIKTFLNDSVGNQTITMSPNPDVDYDGSHTHTWTNLSTNKGYNFSESNKITSTSLSAINTSITLQDGEGMALWNRTTFTWNWWLPEFYEVDKDVLRWDIIISKVENTEVWNT